MDFDIYRVVVSGHPTDPEDAGVPGEYLFEVPAGTAECAAASAILDLFHGKIGISELDDFTIRVVDEKGRDICEDERPRSASATFLGRK